MHSGAGILCYSLKGENNCQDEKSMFMVWWDKGRYIYDRIFVFNSSQSRKPNAPQSWHLVLFAEREQ